MYMFFWFFKQLYYCLLRFFKSGLFLLFLFFIGFLFIFVRPVCAVNATDIPQVVLTKAKEVNHNIDNFVILQDVNKHDYYIPYGSIVNNNYTSNWFVTTFKDTFVLVAPSWGRMTLLRYTNNAYFEDVALGSIGSNSTVQFDYVVPSTGYNRVLKVVYASQKIIYSGVSGHEDGETYFNPFSNPFIENPSSEISSWNFNTLKINGAELRNSTSYGQNFFTLKAVYNNNEYLLDIDDYKTVSGNSVTFSIPKNSLLNSAYLRNNYKVDFSLIYYESLEGGRRVSEFSLGSYTFAFSSEEQDVVNQDNTQQLLGDIKEGQQQVTNSINNLDNTIKDTNVDNSSIYLPNDNTQDITQDGINNIFTNIYNAFCTGETKDIIFPIPFTNKNIVLSANYIREMLTNSSANWVITIIEAFWWYLISRFIIVDVSRKITKIKSGNVENIENDNIKEEML